MKVYQFTVGIESWINRKEITCGSNINHKLILKTISIHFYLKSLMLKKL